ncbi:MAG: hypothetical protein H8D45_05195 [Bacteroidetes bacterium]|nr:hypothetical protein [Bacteroidota bacterium]MBL7104346.1 hypothetical protein [Bacteroidales bacterium]
MKGKQKTPELFDTLVKKAILKQLVYQNTVDTLQMLKAGMQDLVDKYEALKLEGSKKIPFTYKDRGEFEAELKFGGDTLVFMMHTNVFEFSRDHEVMKTPYIKEDISRSYCGIINIFNFLSDSFKYDRVNDVGYMIGRVFINKDKHYFIEGKREIGFLYNSFANSLMNKDTAGNILESAILYTINFDLLTPPYDSVKEVTVKEFNAVLGSMQIKTGKRLGFKFQADPE